MEGVDEEEKMEGLKEGPREGREDRKDGNTSLRKKLGKVFRGWKDKRNG